MTSQQTPSEAPLEAEFPLYDPTPTGAGGPTDNPAPDSHLVPGGGEPPAPGPHQTPTNRRNLLVLAGAGAVGLAGVGWLFARPDGDRRARSGKLTLPEGSTSFQLTTTSGRVTVRGTDGAATGSWSGGGNSGPHIDQTGEVATVTARGSSDLELELPTGSTVEVHTKSGDVKIEEVGLETLTIRTTSGDVTVRDSAPGSVTARTTSGGVDMELTEAPDAVSVSTTSGDVEISVPGRGYRYETDTRSGDVDVPDNSGDVPINIRTTSGDVEIEES